MSNKIGLVILVLVCSISAAFGAAYTDGVYTDKPYIAPATAVVDINAGKVSAVSTPSAPQVASADAPIIDIGDALGSALKDVSTSTNFNVNTQQAENQAVSQVTVAANFTANKGPMYVQYSHTRSYSRNVDPCFGTTDSQFQGVVNNTVTVGVSFTPDFSKNQSSVACNPNETQAAAAVTPVAKASTVTGSAIN